MHSTFSVLIPLQLVVNFIVTATHEDAFSLVVYSRCRFITMLADILMLLNVHVVQKWQ
jgi:hypothetical protein